MPGEVRMKWIIQESIQLVAKQPGTDRPGRVAGTRELVVSGLPYIIPYFEQDGSVIFCESCMLHEMACVLLSYQKSIESDPIDCSA